MLKKANDFNVPVDPAVLWIAAGRQRVSVAGSTANPRDEPGCIIWMPIDRDRRVLP
jgi:hypothetical protein